MQYTIQVSNSCASTSLFTVVLVTPCKGKSIVSEVELLQVLRKNTACALQEDPFNERHLFYGAAAGAYLLPGGNLSKCDRFVCHHLYIPYPRLAFCTGGNSW